MVTAIILLNVEHGKVNDVAERLVDMDGVGEVHSVAGRYDLVAILRVKDNETLADVATNAIQTVPGIEHSETLIGFRVFSRHDLERLFAVGMEE